MHSLPWLKTIVTLTRSNLIDQIGDVLAVHSKHLFNYIFKKYIIWFRIPEVEPDHHCQIPIPIPFCLIQGKSGLLPSVHPGPCKTQAGYFIIHQNNNSNNNTSKYNILIIY